MSRHTDVETIKCLARAQHYFVTSNVASIAREEGRMVIALTSAGGGFERWWDPDQAPVTVRELLVGAPNRVIGIRPIGERIAPIA